MERAVDWLFNHPDATGDFGDDGPVATTTGSSAEESSAAANKEDTLPAKFRLSSIVCHKGTSIHAGHYVAFVNKDLPEGGKGWVLFNDEKVASGGDGEEMSKFAYVYFFRREGV